MLTVGYGRFIIKLCVEFLSETVYFRAKKKVDKKLYITAICKLLLFDKECETILKSICKKEDFMMVLDHHKVKEKIAELKMEELSEEFKKCSIVYNKQSIDDVIAGSLINKEKRRELFGQVAGGAGSRKPEDYQRKKITDGTGFACPKTNMRINLRKNTLNDISQPNTKNDGFDYSEDFDGSQTIKDKKVYINLKCIVGKGGSQTRSLREVYWFIEGQLKTLSYTENIYFANILDGDEAYTSMTKFNYLLNLPEFDSVKNRVYVGDLKGYFDWFIKMFDGK